MTRKIYKLNNVTIDSYVNEVYLANEYIHLTKKEFELLRYLVENVNKVCTRDEIISNIWGNEFDGYEQTLDTHIHRIRKKLGSIEINTISKIGYQLIGG